MKPFQIYIITLSVLFFFCYSTASGQEAGDFVAVKLLSGGVIKGTLVELSDDEIQMTNIKQNIGTTVIPRYEVEEITKVTNIERALTPDASRYLWGTNGYGVEPDRFYVKNLNLSWFEIEYGIDENFSIGAAFIVPFVIFVTPTYHFPIQENFLNLKIGLLAGTVTFPITRDNRLPVFGLMYGMATFGPPSKNFTLGVFYGFSGANADDVSLAESPSFFLGGRYSFNEKWGIQGEAYIFKVSDKNFAIPIFSIKYTQDDDDTLSAGFIIINDLFFGEDIFIPAYSYTIYLD